MWKNKKANSVQFCQLYDPFKQQLRNILIKAQPRDKLESWLIARIIADKVNSFKCNVSKYESVNEARCVPSPDKHCQRTVPYSSFSTSESNCSESLCVSLVSHNRTLKAVHSSAVLAYQKLQLSKRGNCNSNCTKRRTEDYRSDRTSDLLGTVREGLENRKSAAGGGELSYVSSIWAVSASSADASTIQRIPRKNINTTDILQFNTFVGRFHFWDTINCNGLIVNSNHFQKSSKISTTAVPLKTLQRVKHQHKEATEKGGRAGETRTAPPLLSQTFAEETSHRKVDR
ncbi:conserved hypothetical protein [Trichinella spiralis]|uniref:hypothetical protein n=1 Tax=Trichinella spiralis TaxID=6334 RepID=UPI0001EFF064|nr:conserved hypothetical protein [Trichinella spiralis]